MDKHFIECRHSIRGDVRWERITVGNNLDDGFPHPEMAKDAVAKLRQHPSIHDVRIVREEDTDG